MNRIEFGDCRDIMRRWIADGVKVQTCVTSPPYWGLRDYGVKGQLGLEPTLPEFIANMVEVFSVVWDLLADDGVLWLNMGDSYAGSRSGPDQGSTLEGSRNNQNEAKRAKQAMTQSRRRDDHPIPRSDVRVGNLKPKDLVGQPWRLAFALQGFAVVPSASLAQWAEWLREAREANDWEAAQIVEGRLRAACMLDGLREAGWYLRQDIIWHKPNPMPESVRDRCTKAHEYIFLLSKSERYYFDQDAIKEPCSPNTHARLSQDVQNQVGSARAHAGARSNGNMKAVGAGYAAPTGWPTHDGAHGSFHRDGRERKQHLPGNKSHKGTAAYEAGDERQRTKAGLVEYARKLEAAGSGTKNNTSFDKAMAVMPTHRNKRSVWTIASEPFSGAHFATFPTELVRPCILAGSRPGDVVLDPFIGSGTTAQVALELGRQYLGCELNQSYEPLQQSRIRQQGLALA